MLVWGMALVGRAIGGLIHYRVTIPAKVRYSAALTVYVVISVLEGVYLFTPVPVMMIMCFIVGIGGITTAADVLEMLMAGATAVEVGAANLVNAYDPELLILGGGASRIREMRSAIQAHLDRYCWGRVRVAAADNPEASVALGLSGLFEKREKRGKYAFSEQL